MQLYIQRLESSCLKFFRFLSHGSKGDKFGRFQTSYQRYKSLTYRLISPERSNHTIVMEKAKVAMYFKSLTAIWQFTSVWILKAEASHDRCENWTELIFSKDQRINHFFPLCFFLTQEPRLISLVTWWNHVASCTAAHLDARSSVVFWVNFSGISALFYSSRSLYITKATALFGIVSFL